MVFEHFVVETLREFHTVTFVVFPLYMYILSFVLSVVVTIGERNGEAIDSKSRK